MGVTNLAREYGLSADSAAQLLALLELLARDRAAPTSIREPDRIVNDHLADSLIALKLPAVRDASTLADIGSGAGLPGLALAIVAPDLHVWLVESAAQKCRFLERAVAACGASNAAVVNARAEEWADGRCHHDIVTARAVAPLAVVAEYAAPLLRVGASLVAWRGKRDAAAERAAERAAVVLGLTVEPALQVVPFSGAAHRHLHVMRKLTETPARFPRRAGVARKRPLA